MSARVPGLSIFFPCHDEAPHVVPLVRSSLATAARLAEEFEVIVVDDGSTDGTTELAAETARADPRVRLVRHATRRGYGRALRSGFAAARHDLVFYTDGDRQYRVEELGRVLPAIEGCDVLSCYRLRRRDDGLRDLNARLYGLALRLLFGLNLRDVDCAFKVYRRRVLSAMELTSEGALIDAEMLVKARRAGFRIRQLPVHHYPRTAGRQSGADPTVILRALRELARFRLNKGGGKVCSSS